MRQLPGRTSEGLGSRCGHGRPGSSLGHLARLALIALAAIAAGCGADDSAAPASLDELAHRSLATLDGELAAPGLKEPVEVIRDEWGVPHIYAAERRRHVLRTGLCHGAGPAVADGDVASLARGTAWPRSSVRRRFDYDRRTRLMMFRGPWNETEWTSYHPDAKRLFTAHANGVNAYIAQHRDNLPVEFQLTGIVPVAMDRRDGRSCAGPRSAVPSVRGHAINEIQLALERRPLRRRGGEPARSPPTPGTTWSYPRASTSSIIHRGHSRRDARR